MLKHSLRTLSSPSPYGWLLSSSTQMPNNSSTSHHTHVLVVSIVQILVISVGFRLDVSSFTLILIMALVTLIILTSIFAGIMKGNNCTFPFIPYVTGTIISELALGSAGFFVSVLSNSVIAGYLTAMGYFLFNFLGDISSKSIFYLFSMGTGSYFVKLWLTLFSVLLIVISLIFEKKKIY